MAAILSLVYQSSASFLYPVEPDPVTLSCPLQPLLSVPHLPLKASLARLATVPCIIPSPSLGPECLERSQTVCHGVMGRAGSRLVARLPAQFWNTLGHRSCLYCEAALKPMGDPRMLSAMCLDLSVPSLHVLPFAFPPCFSRVLGRPHWPQIR